MFSEKDGTPSIHTAHAIKCMDTLSSGKAEIPFWLDGVFDNWEVFVTDQRIAVRNPFRMALFRKPKEKTGKVSVGHIPYKAMTNLSAIFSNKNIPVLICACYRHDGTRSAIVIESVDMESLKGLAADLHERIDRWIISNNKKIVVDESTDASMKEAVSNWNSFLDKAWSAPEVTVFVPCKEWDRVPDSNF